MQIPEVTFLKPWHGPPGDASALEKELALEVSRGHPLFGRKMYAVSQRQDNDDVLFISEDALHEVVAVVHLTWSLRAEVGPQLPSTVLFDSVESWVERGMKVDHANFA
jgi:hypothetical protein